MDVGGHGSEGVCTCGVVDGWVDIQRTIGACMHAFVACVAAGSPLLPPSLTGAHVVDCLIPGAVRVCLYLVENSIFFYYSKHDLF